MVKISSYTELRERPNAYERSIRKRIGTHRRVDVCQKAIRNDTGTKIGRRRLDADVGRVRRVIGLKSGRSGCAPRKFSRPQTRKTILLGLPGRLRNDVGNERVGQPSATRGQVIDRSRKGILFLSRRSSSSTPETNSALSPLPHLLPFLYFLSVPDRIKGFGIVAPLDIMFRFVSFLCNALSLRYAFRHNIRVLFAIFVNSFARCCFFFFFFFFFFSRTGAPFDLLRTKVKRKPLSGRATLVRPLFEQNALDAYGPASGSDSRKLHKP